MKLLPNISVDYADPAKKISTEFMLVIDFSKEENIIFKIPVSQADLLNVISGLAYFLTKGENSLNTCTVSFGDEATD